MPSKKCKCKNCKCKIKVKQKATLAKKGEAKKDTLKSVEGRPPANNAPTLKLKIRKKMNTIVYKARVLLINMGKMLPFILCGVIAIAYIESFISLTIQDLVVWNDNIILNNSISWFIGKYFEYDLVTLVALLVLSISTETCYWNKLACIYLGVNLIEKSYFDFELEPATIYIICMLNIAISGYLTYKGIKILTK